VKAYCHLVRQIAAAERVPASERIADGLRRIDSVVNRMTGQIDELLDATRIQLGQPLTLQRQPLDLVNLVRQVVAELANGNQAHRILVEAPLPSLDCAVDGA